MSKTLAMTLALAFAAIAALPADATTSQTYRYVGGASSPVSVPVYQGGFCSADLLADGTYAGGVCHVPVAPGLVTVQVAPDAGLARFLVEVLDEPEPSSDPVQPSRTCAFTRGDGALTFEVPEGCDAVSVYLQAGAVSGTIVITQA